MPVTEPTTESRELALRPTADVYRPRDPIEAMKVASVIAKSGILGKVPPRAEAVYFLMMRGSELGFTTAQSLDAFDILDGRPTLKAEAKVALCNRRTDVCRWIRCTESTEDRATWETLRVGHPEVTRHTYALADAKRAGLLGKPNWQKHPRTMLRWRAASELIRLVYPDLTLGIYSTDEAEEIAASEGREPVRGVIDVTPTQPDGGSFTVERPDEAFLPAVEPTGAPPSTATTPDAQGAWDGVDDAPGVDEAPGPVLDPRSFQARLRALTDDERAEVIRHFGCSAPVKWLRETDAEKVREAVETMDAIIQAHRA